MDPITALALALGSAWGSGINLYATVMVLGGLDLFGVIDLPPDLAGLGSTWVLIAAVFMYLVEFVADKIPGVDSIWDVIHTFIRIPAGAFMAAGAVGGIDGLPADFQTAVALVGGGAVAAGTHAAKAGTRAVINTSPEPFTNWGMSFLEDILVFSGLAAAIYNPFAFFIAAGLFLLLLIWIVPKIWRGIRRFFGGMKDPAGFRRDRVNMTMNAAPSGAAPPTPGATGTNVAPPSSQGKDADFF